MMINAQNLRKTYRADRERLAAVDGAVFSCRKGDYVSIVGHSGSGKSTLLSLLGGLTRPDSGSIVIDGTDILALSDNDLAEFRNRKLNFIFQFASLMPTLTALENVILPTAFSPDPRPRQETAREAAELLAAVGLQDKLKAYPGQLSGGQQRRVAIARAFINHPQIILADEPTGDLDEETEAEMIELFRRINRERQVTFVVVTHNSAMAAEAQKMLIMRNGVLQEA